MARRKEKEKAITLRKQEMSYSQIKEILGIGKGTLSVWLKNYPLSKERISQLSWKNERRIERYRETMRNKKEKRLNQFYVEQKSKIFPLTEKDFFIAGLFLYWGEGGKTSSSSLTMSNTDPAVINFFIDWAVNHLNFSKENIYIKLHLYNDMNVEKEIKFWSEKLNLPIKQFRNPYIKKTSFSSINYKRSFGHGTCNAILGNARLSEKILMAIKSISDRYANAGL